MTTRDSRYDVCLPMLWQPWHCPDLVRLGPANDGGYLVSLADVMATKKLVSYGIGDNWDFEKSFLDLNDCDLDAYDGQIPTTSLNEVIEWFQGCRRITHKNIVPTGNPHGSTVEQTINTQDIFLKCDIEEDEMRLFNELLSIAHRFTGIVMEVHRIHLWSNYNLVTNFISKLPLKLLHVHANNWGYVISPEIATPSNLELTFGRGAESSIDPDLTLPHALDASNNPKDQDFRIRFNNQSPEM